MVSTADTVDKESIDNEATTLSTWKRKREERLRRRKEAEEKEKANQFLADVDAPFGVERGQPEEEPIMTLAKRRKLEQEKFLNEVSNGPGEDKGNTPTMAQRRKVQAYRALGRAFPEKDETNSERDYENDDTNDLKEFNDDTEGCEQENKVASLLDRAQELQKTLSASERAEQQRKEEEDRILKESSKVQTNALQSAKDVAHGVVYAESMPSSWSVPRSILSQGEATWEKIRKEWHMVRH